LLRFAKVSDVLFPAIIEIMRSERRFDAQRVSRTHSRGYIKLALIILMLLVIIGGATFLYFKRTRHGLTASDTTTSTKSSQPSSKPHRIRLIATGDFNYNDTVNLSAKNNDGSYDYLKLMPKFPDIFKAADIRFCNQITLIAGDKYPIQGYPKFNAPLDAADDMQKLGCNLINMASNHSFDINQDAITTNVNEWAKLPGILAAAGQNRSPQEMQQVHYFTIQGVKFAFVAYTTYINNDAPVQNDYGVTQFNKTLAHMQIAEAKQNGAQFIIASMRWGTEYSPDITSEQKNDAQFLADEGVSLVLGHGTHVAQPVDTLTGVNGNKTTVWYGLGNYINSQIPAETLFGGLGVIDIDPDTRQISANQLLPLYVHYEWTAAQSKSEDLLTRKNFKMYLLEDTTQQMIDSEQLHTSIAEQKQRLQSVLNKQGTNVPLITSAQYYSK
jgi:poly-gamma-glutamate capsule biosynthesis protein CapA/YwtB (metallophosphatase superfamily)